MAALIQDALRRQSAQSLAVQLVYRPGQDSLNALLEALAQLGEAGHGTIRDPLFHSPEKPASTHESHSDRCFLPLIPGQPGLTPDFRARLLKLPEGRHGRGATQDRLRHQLLTTLPHDDDWRLPVQAAPELGNRTLLANMEGEASILAEDYEARFSAGVWQGFFAAPSGNGAIRFRPSTGTAIIAHGKTLAYSVESSVSFETDHSRGLRDMLILDTEECRIPGRMITDYVLTDHGNQLLVDVQLRYPWIEDAPTIDEVQPYCLSVDLSPDSADLRIRWRHFHDQANEALLWEGSRQSGAGSRDDSGAKTNPISSTHLWKWLFRSRRGHAEAEAPKCVCERYFFGHQWTITWQTAGQRQGLAIFRLPSESTSSAPMEIRVHQENGNRGLILDIYPEGRYRTIPSGDLRSLNHHFVVGICPIFDAEKEPEPPGDKIERECSPFFMVRES
jgi:hypothetical protein